MEQIITFNYLGIDMSDQHLHKEVTHQVRKSATISVTLNDAVWKNKYIRLVYIPHLTYANLIPEQTLRKKKKQSSRTSEMKI